MCSARVSKAWEERHGNRSRLAGHPWERAFSIASSSTNLSLEGSVDESRSMATPVAKILIRFAIQSLAGLRTGGLEKRSTLLQPTGHRFPAHDLRACIQCLLMTFVSTYRCGAVGDLHPIPFLSTTITWGRPATRPNISVLRRLSTREIHVGNA